jgi:thiol:disulfide interchange protein DsbC
MKRLVLLAIAISLLGAFSAVMAQPQAAAFQKSLNERFPTTVGAKVEPAFPGFWAVIKDGDVFFVREDLTLLIRGEVLDLKSNESLTANLLEANRPRIAPSALDTRDAIAFGSGARHLYVFSDPDCPFCRRLESELAKLHDVQVFVFPFPLTSLHPNAATVAETLWCQQDRASAWRQYLSTGVAPAAAHCDNPIARNVALGQRLQVRGTPALIFDDGTVIPGAVTAERIEAQLTATAHK